MSDEFVLPVETPAAEPVTVPEVPEAVAAPTVTEALVALEQADATVVQVATDTTHGLGTSLLHDDSLYVESVSAGGAPSVEQFVSHRR